MSEPNSYYCSERNFRKFEQIISLAVKAFPKLTKCTNENSDLSLNTFVARLRDAVTSYKKNSWPSELITKADMVVVTQLKVAQRGPIVYIGSRAELKALNGEPVITAIEIVPPSGGLPLEPIFMVNRDYMKLIAHLGSWRLFNQPIPIYGMTEEDVEWMDLNYDVYITKDTSGKFGDKTVYIINV